MSIFHVIIIFVLEHATVTILNAKDGVLGNDEGLRKPTNVCIKTNVLVSVFFFFFFKP